MLLTPKKGQFSQGLTHFYAPGESPQNLAVSSKSDKFIRADWGASKWGKLAGAIGNSFPSITLGNDFTLLLVFRTQTVGAAPLGGRKLFSGGISMDAIHSASSYSGALYYGSSFTIAGKPTGGALVDNTDYSLVIVRSGNSIKTFLNGVLTVDHTGSVSLSNSTFQLNPDLSGPDPATADPILFSLFGKYDRALTNAEAKLLSRQPRQVFEPEAVHSYFNTATSGSLSGDNSNQFNLSSVASATQTHVTTGANATQDNSSSAASVSQTHITTGAASDQQNTSSAAAIIAAGALTGANSQQANESTAAAVAQTHITAGANATQDNTSSVAAIVADGSIVLTGQNSNQSNASAAASVAQTHVLPGVGSSQQNTSATAGIINPLDQAIEPCQGFIVYSQLRRYTSSSSKRRYKASAYTRQYRINHVG